MTQRTAPKFRKPPVVEVWISIDFDPNVNKRQWDLELVQQYVRQYHLEFPKLEVVHQRQIQVQETSPTDLPKIVAQQVRVESVRLWNATRTRTLQIGDDNLSYHMLKSDEGAPGYRTVREAAQSKLEDYSRTFEPSQIRNATLHYLDIIEIPRPENGKLDLKDYFVPSVDLPEEPFGPISGLSYQFQVMCPVDPGPLFLQLQAMASPPESDVFRFRMEWHKQSSEVNTLDLAQVWARMDIAHEYMRQCFLAAFPQRTLELFEPIDENE